VTPPDTGEAVPEIVLNKGVFIWPVKGKIIKPFGMSDGFKNDGIDIAASTGSKVVAAYSGKVVFASDLKGMAILLLSSTMINMRRLCQ